MDFATLIKKSFSFAWNNRILWIFGLLSGGVSGAGSMNPGGFNFTFPGSSTEDSSEKVQGISKVLGASDFNTEFLTSDMLMVLVLLIVLIALLVLIFAVFVTNWAGAGLVYSILGRNKDRPTFKAGASAGLKYWWRYFKISLIFFAAVVAVLAMLAIPVGLLFLSRMEVFAIVALIVAGIIFLVFIFLIAIVGSLIITISQRVVIHKEKGALESIRLAGGLVKKNIGESALTWLVAAGVSFGAGFAAIIALLPIGAVIFVLFLVNIWLGFIAVIPAMIIGLAAAGFWNAVMATYWTLFYEHLASKEGW